MRHRFCQIHSIKWNQDESEECVLCVIDRGRRETSRERNLAMIDSLKTAYIQKITSLERKRKQVFLFPEILEVIVKQFSPLTFTNSREQEVVRLRKVLIHLLRDRYYMSFPAIAAFFRKQGLTTYDHTTVIHHYYEKNKTRSSLRPTNNDQRTQDEETTHEI